MPGRLECPIQVAVVCWGKSYPPGSSAPSLAMPCRGWSPRSPFQDHPPREPISVPIHPSLGTVFRKAPCKGQLSQFPIYSHKRTGPSTQRADRGGRGLGSHSSSALGTEGQGKSRWGPVGDSVLAGPRLALPGGASDSQGQTGGVSSQSRNQTGPCWREKHPIL